MFSQKLPGVREIFVLLLCLTSLAVAQDGTLRERMLLAEDARARTAEQLAVLREGLGADGPELRRQAVRAIGRLERPELMDLAAARLNDAHAAVRAEAANAIGQLATTGEAAAAALALLLPRLEAEADPAVRGVVAATIGRLPFTEAEPVARAGAAIAALLPSREPEADGAKAAGQFPGAAEGLEALIRLRRKIQPPSAEILARLRATALLHVSPGGATSDVLLHARRLAILALTGADAVDQPLVEAALADPDAEVRRLAAAAAGAATEITGRAVLLKRALADRHPQVRYEALRGLGRHLQATTCAPMVQAVQDAVAHVALLAIDLLGSECTGGALPVPTLLTLADSLTPLPSAWHKPAHALVSLAHVAPDEARARLSAYTSHSVWQVRMYAARAAQALAAVDVLEKLAGDPVDNVRDAALGALIELERPEAAAIAIDALTRNDYQLIMTATRALADPAIRAKAEPSLLDALARLTAEPRDTSRDPRMAILDRLAAYDSAPEPETVDALREYLGDFDPAIAARAAAIIGEWTGTAPPTASRPLPTPEVTLGAIEALRGQRLQFTMAGGGVIELRLLLDEAPISALRVATRASEGYYDGLTFHRIAPNFVVQGGSPGANEYMGDDRYMRDEVGLVTHARGTVGISTRGRDTGDAQIFVNLIDSPRLDHVYTVFAEVVEGMDIVDRLLEGAVIDEVKLVAIPSP